MQTKTTISTYYENGAKSKGASFWKRLWNNNFGSEFQKAAQAIEESPLPNLY